MKPLRRRNSAAAAVALGSTVGLLTGLRASASNPMPPVAIQPTAAMKREAQRGLDARAAAPRSRKGGLDRGQAAAAGITSGVEQAKRIVRGEWMDAPQMYRFFARFKGTYERAVAQDPSVLDHPERSKIVQAWLLWGGDPGYREVVRALEREGVDVKSKPRKNNPQGFPMSAAPIVSGKMAGYVLYRPRLYHVTGMTEEELDAREQGLVTSLQQRGLTEDRAKSVAARRMKDIRRGTRLRIYMTPEDAREYDAYVDMGPDDRDEFFDQQMRRASNPRTADRRMLRNPPASQEIGETIRRQDFGLRYMIPGGEDEAGDSESFFRAQFDANSTRQRRGFVETRDLGGFGIPVGSLLGNQHEQARNTIGELRIPPRPRIPKKRKNESEEGYMLRLQDAEQEIAEWEAQYSDAAIKKMRSKASGVANETLIDALSRGRPGPRGMPDAVVVEQDALGRGETIERVGPPRQGNPPSTLPPAAQQKWTSIYDAVYGRTKNKQLAASVAWTNVKLDYAQDPKTGKWKKARRKNPEDQNLRLIEVEAEGFGLTHPPGRTPPGHRHGLGHEGEQRELVPRTPADRTTQAAKRRLSR